MAPEIDPCARSEDAIRAIPDEAIDFGLMDPPWWCPNLSKSALISNGVDRCR